MKITPLSGMTTSGICDFSTSLTHRIDYRVDFCLWNNDYLWTITTGNGSRAVTRGYLQYGQTSVQLLHQACWLHVLMNFLEFLAYSKCYNCKEGFLSINFKTVSFKWFLSNGSRSMNYGLLFYILWTTV